MTSLDSFKCCKTLKVGSKTYAYYSLPLAEKNGLKGISRLPFSMKVLLENLLRHEDGRTVTKPDIQAVAQWLKKDGDSVAMDDRASMVEAMHERVLALVGELQPEEDAPPSLFSAQGVR